MAHLVIDHKRTFDAVFLCVCSWPHGDGCTMDGDWFYFQTGNMRRCHVNAQSFSIDWSIIYHEIRFTFNEPEEKEETRAETLRHGNYSFGIKTHHFYVRIAKYKKKQALEHLTKANLNRRNFFSLHFLALHGIAVSAQLHRTMRKYPLDRLSTFSRCIKIMRIRFFSIFFFFVSIWKIRIIFCSFYPLLFHIASHRIVLQNFIE